MKLRRLPMTVLFFLMYGVPWMVRERDCSFRTIWCCWFAAYVMARPRWLKRVVKIWLAAFRWARRRRCQ